MRPMRIDRKQNLGRVMRFIQANPNTYFNDIRRELGIGSGSLRQILDFLEPFIQTSGIGNDEPTFPNTPIFLRAKPGFDLIQLDRKIKVTDRVRQIMRSR